jgi:hypothetical protein
MIVGATSQENRLITLGVLIAQKTRNFLQMKEQNLMQIRPESVEFVIHLKVAKALHLLLIANAWNVGWIS